MSNVSPRHALKICMWCVIWNKAWFVVWGEAYVECASWNSWIVVIKSTVLCICAMVICEDWQEFVWDNAEQAERILCRCWGSQCTNVLWELFRLSYSLHCLPLYGYTLRKGTFYSTRFCLLVNDWCLYLVINLTVHLHMWELRKGPIIVMMPPVLIS